MKDRRSIFMFFFWLKRNVITDQRSGISRKVRYRTKTRYFSQNDLSLKNKQLELKIKKIKQVLFLIFWFELHESLEH